MNKADTPEQKEALRQALDDSEAVRGARDAVKQLYTETCSVCGLPCSGGLRENGEPICLTCEVL